MSDWISSSMRILEESPLGKDLGQFLKSEFEPAVGKYAQQLMSKGIAPPDAKSQAIKDLKTQYFGPSGENLVKAVRAIHQQKGLAAANHAADFLDVYFKDSQSYWRESVVKGKPKAGIPKVPINRSSFYKGEGQLNIAGKTITENQAKRIGRTAFLPLITIPHATQALLNSIATFTFKDTMSAAAEFIKDPKSARDFAMKSGALSHDLVYEYIDTLKGQSKLSKVLDPLRRAFNFERKWQIGFSAVIGKHVAEDAAQRLLSGDKRAEIELKILGLDPQTIRRQGGITLDNLEKAAYLAADKLMGFGSTLDIPYVWKNNATHRLATAYKDYGFREAKLIKDAFKNAKQGEGWKGVAKLTAAMSIMWPIVGEMNKAAESLVTLRNAWSDDDQKNAFLHNEYFDAIAHAGGFGIVYSAMRSASHNNLAGWVIGPYLGLPVDITQDIMNARIAQASKRVIRRFGLPGRAISNVIPQESKGRKSSGYGEYSSSQSYNKSY